MNILFVNDIPFNPVAGGIERVTDVLTKELLKRGHLVYYLCGKLPSSKKHLCDYEFPAEVYQLPNDGLFEDDYNLTFYKTLLLDLKIDVVINQRGLGGKFNALLPITQTKLISVINSTPDAYVLIRLNKIVELSAPPFIKLKKLIKNVFSLPIKAYWRRKAMAQERAKYNELAQYSSAIVTLSRQCVVRLKNLIDNPPGTIMISIPNPNTYDSIVTEDLKKEKIVLYVGRLAKAEKNPLRLLKIWKKLYKKHLEWKLVFVGEGEERGRMEDYIEKHKLSRVFFEGRQSDVAQYYAKATFVCLTSNFEGWGMALTEGMQYGCIPFTFNNYGAANDIIDDGVNGCLIPAFDLKKYAKRMSELMVDDTRRLQMSKSAIEKVNIYSVESVADEWDALLSSC